MLKTQPGLVSLTVLYSTNRLTQIRSISAVKRLALGTNIKIIQQPLVSTVVPMELLPTIIRGTVLNGAMKVSSPKK